MFYINIKKSFVIIIGKLLVILYVIICKGVLKCYEIFLCIWYMYFFMIINLYVLLKILILRKKNIFNFYGYDFFILFICVCNWWIERVLRVFIDIRGKKIGYIYLLFVLEIMCLLFINWI